MTLALPRRRVLAGLAACAAAFSTRGFAASGWPTKAVRIIVPFAPGGGADSSARLLADLFAPALGQGVIVENKPGAGSAIGVAAAAAAKDGHTLLMASNSMVINPSLNPQLGSDPARDFDAIGMVSAQPLVLVVPAGAPAKSFQDLVAQAKAQPGMTAGNSGNGTLAHIASEIFAGQVGTQITPVAYKGESALLPEMISGLVDFGFLNLPSVAPHLQSGRLRALAVSSPQEVPELPGVPTVRALGFAALEVQGWAALLAPRGTIPAQGLARLESLLAQALQSQAARSRFALLNVSPFILSRSATTQFLQQETARYAVVIQARGIKAG
ncbi:tripartite tricarboxylate transporter substrate binding protein [Xenophilus sp. Marseille-Q4582]|uniref:Bug family tripartite tricarboxylate transporter substrate binding protein n=1 Tax=Xenophilus sp. Marseille-Q4582 TaxID=2866600 RepID=UPI001CE48D21|nr:tripartite tricarboxylate transporter substrate binding protein [Xenophilus sp. Marseille-Q4582]